MKRFTQDLYQNKPPVTSNLFGLTIRGRIVIGDWDGDPSIPNGVRHWPPYIEDLEVLSPDGTDMLDYLTDECVDLIIDDLLER